MIHRYNTLRVRFALWTAGLLFVTLVLFGIFFYALIGSELAQSLDDSLQLSAAQAASAAVENGQISETDGIPETAAITSLHDRGFTIRILRLDGTTLTALGEYSTLPVSTFDRSTFRKRQTRFDTVIEPLQHDAVRFNTTPIIINDQVVAVVQVAQSLDTINDVLERLLTTMLISVPLFVALIAIGGYFLAARSLAPIDTIAATAQRISAQGLHERLSLSPTQDEIGRLGATFDSMLERLEDSFRRERQFTADASHELRTPLTAMQTIIGVTRQNRRSPEQYENALDNLESQADSLGGLVEDLLRLARSDIGSMESLEQVDVSTLLRDVIEVMNPLAQAKTLALNCKVPNDIYVMGSSDDLVRLFMNLVANAVKYTEDGEITVDARQDPQCIWITVSDTGIGIDSESKPHLFDRFYRVDPSRSIHGNGLGLSIAEAIVKAHHGKINVSSELGKGTTFTVAFPVSPPLN